MQWLKKRPLPLYALDAADVALDLTYRWWNGLRDGGLLPSRSQVDTPQFRLLVPAVHWVDMRDKAPERIDLGPLAGFSEVLPAATGGGSPGYPLGRLLREDFRTVAYTGSALFQEIHLAQHGLVTVYAELLLPVADDGVKVSEVLLLVRQVCGQPVSERLATPT